MPLHIHPCSASELVSELAAFVHLLKDAVDHGASLGFFPPLDLGTVRGYWLSLRDELRQGTRVLLVARAADGRIVGTGQIALPTLPSSRHRAEVQKLLVDSRDRGGGIGRRLMEALHEEALARGRTLIVLGTRFGERPEGFYRRLGYREAGVIPGYTIDAAGRRFDRTNFYLDLGAAVTRSPPPGEVVTTT